MKTIKTTIRIDASPQAVWSIMDDDPCGGPEFVGLVSSLNETGTSPSFIETIRGRFAELRIPAYDGFSPEIMDLIAWHRRKIDRLPQPAQ